MKALILFFFAIILFYSCQENRTSALVDEKGEVYVIADSILVYDSLIHKYRFLEKEVWHFSKGDLLAFKTDRAEGYEVWYAGTGKRSGHRRSNSYAPVLQVAPCIFCFEGDTTGCLATKNKNGFWVVQTFDEKVIFDENSKITFRPLEITLERSLYQLFITEQDTVIRIPYLGNNFLCEYIGLPYSKENRRNGLNGPEKLVIKCPNGEKVWVDLKTPICAWGANCILEPVLEKVDIEN